MTRLVLASQSPSRRRVLDQAGVVFDVEVSSVDEPAVVEAASAGAELSAAETALLLARAKAEAVAALPASRNTLVLGCDSVFELDGVTYGKPYEVDVAVERWQQMRGRTGTLHTGHWLVDAGTAATTAEHSWLGSAAMTKGPLGVPESTLTSAGETVSSQVRFAEPSDEQIRAYAESGEALHCAGAFTLEGRGAAFIDRVEGDPNAVIGLSPAALNRLLSEFGRSITDFWT